MAKYGSDKAWLHSLGYDLTGQLTDFSHNVEAVLTDCTVLGQSWQVQQFVSLRKTDISLNGYYDDAAKASVDALAARDGLDHVMVYGVAGQTIGKLFTGFVGAMQTNVNRVAVRGELHKISAKFVGDGMVEEGGVILRPLASATASTGNTQAQSYDGGASSTRGGSAYFQLNDLVLDGTSTGFTAEIRHSVDNNTFATLVAFTQVTSSALAPLAQRSALVSTGSVNRYLAAAWAQSATAANSTNQATFWAGFVRGIAVP